MYELKKPERLGLSESHFRQIVESIPEVFFLEDSLARNMLYISPAYQAIWGRSCESLYANPRSWMESIHPDDREMVVREYAVGLSAGAFEFEYRIACPDGSIRWIEAKGFPVRDDAGRTVGVTGVARDITERKRIMLELGDTKLRLDSIVRSAMDAIVSTDDAQRIVLFNVSAERMFGYTSDELMGQPLDLLLPARFHAEHETRIAAFARAGSTSRKMGSLRPVIGMRKNGEEFPVEVSISRDESTGRSYFTAILRDVTERELAEEVMLKRAEELEKFHRLSVGRELQMIALKKQINLMATEAGQVAPYDLAFLNLDPAAKTPMP